MQVLPISAKLPEAADEELDVPQKSRRLRYLGRPDLLFLIVVALPLLAAILYFGFLASDVYISESRFVVRAPD
jgi:capsule polysaccharide export protein KpsE/RkpR